MNSRSQLACMFVSFIHFFLKNQRKITVDPYGMELILLVSQIHAIHSKNKFMHFVMVQISMFIKI